MSFERHPPSTKRPPSPEYMSELVQYNNNTRDFNSSMQRNMAMQNGQIEIMKKIQSLLEEDIALTKLQRPRGKTSAFRFTVTPTSKLVHLDFITGDRDSTNIPDNSVAKFSFEKLYSISITNEGPDSILYSLNVDKSSGDVNGRLAANQTSPAYDYQFPTFETANVSLAPSSVSGATISINGLY